MSIESKIWKRKRIEISLNELNDIQVEATEGADDTMYRLVVIKNDGTVIPLHSTYRGGLGASLTSYKKRALQLCEFIGLGNNKTL